MWNFQFINAGVEVNVLCISQWKLCNGNLFAQFLLSIKCVFRKMKSHVMNTKYEVIIRVRGCFCSRQFRDSATKMPTVNVNCSAWKSKLLPISVIHLEFMRHVPHPQKWLPCIQPLFANLRTCDGKIIKYHFNHRNCVFDVPLFWFLWIALHVLLAQLSRSFAV